MIRDLSVIKDSVKTLRDAIKGAYKELTAVVDSERPRMKNGEYDDEAINMLSAMDHYVREASDSISLAYDDLCDFEKKRNEYLRRIKEDA